MHPIHVEPFVIFSSANLLHRLFRRSEKIQNLSSFRLIFPPEYGRPRLAYSRNPNGYPVYGNLHCAHSTTRVIQLNSDDRGNTNKPLT